MSSEVSVDPGARFVFHDIGFHGDRYLLKLVEALLHRCDLFVETGSNVGTTVAYVGRTHPDITCLSCEPDKEAFSLALRNTAELPNVKITDELSEKFLANLFTQSGYAEKNILFWLDAHGYGFRWPLREELSIITNTLSRAYILIDDFLVPELPCFGYDRYEGQECSLEYIRSSLSDTHAYRIYFPSYTEKTSKHHPLRGWVLLEFGQETDLLRLSENLARYIKSPSWK